LRGVGELRRQWARLRDLTDRPFAINHTMRPLDPEAFEATLAERPAAISFHIGDPGDLVKRAHDAGIRWIQQVFDLDQARPGVGDSRSAVDRAGGRRRCRVGHRDRSAGGLECTPDDHSGGRVGRGCRTG
jgi:enoyl-[acyl-carrier protein] reductase II